MTDKLMPHNLDAEEAVLGSMLIDPATFPKIASVLETRDFYRDKHQLIFDVCRELNQRGEAINQITVTHKLQGSDVMNAISSDFLSGLIMNTPTPVHAEHYARIVQRCSQKRQIIMAGQAIAELGYTSEPDDGFTEALEKILALRQETQSEGPKPLSQIADEYYPEFDRWVKSGFGMEGLATGFRDLDRVLGGLRGGQLILVAGRASLGKTQFLNMIANHCVQRGDGVLFFSLEMPSRSIFRRLVFARARLDSYQMRQSQGGLFNDEFTEREVKLWNEYHQVSKLPMWIDDTPTLKVQKARARMLTLLARQDIKLMIFDHISLAGDQGDNEVRRLGVISAGLAAISKITNKPVLVACQISRALESRTDHRPRLYDLRDSGNLEQNADVVLGLYRDEYYHPEGTSLYDPKRRNILEVLILKQRDGRANPMGAAKIPIFYEAKTGYMADVDVVNANHQ